MYALFFEDNTRFQTFGFSHIATLLFFALVGWLLLRHAKQLDPPAQTRLAERLSYILPFFVFFYVVARIVIGNFDHRGDLPFDMCNVSALLIPFLMRSRNKDLFGILYFWVLAGTTQALLTPHLYDGFPHYTFLKYFTVHCGLVILILYAVQIYGLRPTLKDFWRAVLGINLYYLVFLPIVNLILDSNYGYVMRKPPTASVLDYFGDWPIYIFVVEALMAVLFFLLYLPFRSRSKNY